MPNREQQLLKWIREDPLISQQTLAERAGITRSAVSVHISNLMRKGEIVGRGYLLSEDNYVAVVGAVNVDISGVSETKLLPNDSNPGHVTVTLGGVGRNIAENLARLGFRVRLITALGSDAHAERIRASCQELGLDISHSLTVPGARTSTYLCLNDVDGEIVAAVNDMAIYASLSPAFLRGKLEMLNRARLVVLDANLTQESIDFLATHCTAPMIADPVSVKKAGKLVNALGTLVFAKPNRPEATLLTGVEIRSYDDLPRAAQAFFRRGQQNVFISLGSEGVYFDDGHTRGNLPCYQAPLVNTTGCGDAFVAAAASGYLEGRTIREMAQMGLAAACLCAQANSAVSPHISMQSIQNIINHQEETEQ